MNLTCKLAYAMLDNFQDLVFSVQPIARDNFVVIVKRMQELQFRFEQLRISALDGNTDTIADILLCNDRDLWS